MPNRASVICAESDPPHVVACDAKARRHDANARNDRLLVRVREPQPVRRRAILLMREVARRAFDFAVHEQVGRNGRSESAERRRWAQRDDETRLLVVNADGVGTLRMRDCMAGKAVGRLRCNAQRDEERGETDRRRRGDPRNAAQREPRFCPWDDERTGLDTSLLRTSWSPPVQQRFKFCPSRREGDAA